MPVGELQRILGDQPTRGLAEDPGCLVRRRRATLTGEFDPFPDRAELAVGPHIREHPSSEALGDLQAPDQQVERRYLPVLELRGAFGRGANRLPRRTREPLKRWHGRPRRPRPFLQRRSGQLAPCLPVAQWVISSRILLVHHFPEFVDPNLAQHRADPIVLAQRQQNVQLTGATIPGLRRHCHRPLEDPLAGRRTPQTPQHQFIAQPLHPRDRSVQIATSDAPLRQDLSPAAPPRARQQQMLGLDNGASQHACLVLGQDKQIGCVAGKQTDPGIIAHCHGITPTQEGHDRCHAGAAPSVAPPRGSLHTSPQVCKTARNDALAFVQPGTTTPTLGSRRKGECPINCVGTGSKGDPRVYDNPWQVGGTR